MIDRHAILVALQVALIALCSYVLGTAFTSFFHNASAATGGLWAVMSGVVVLRETRHKTLSSAWLQIGGTLLGAIIGTGYLWLLPFGALGMAASILVAVLLCRATRMPDHAPLAALAVAVVMVVSSLHPALHPVLSGALRFGEACIGAALAVLAMLLWPPAAAPTTPR